MYASVLHVNFNGRLFSSANGTETIAVPQEDGSYKLYGYKWFSSATDSDMSLTLARIQNPDGSTTPVSSVMGWTWQ